MWKQLFWYTKSVFSALSSRRFTCKSNFSSTFALTFELKTLQFAVCSGFSFYLSETFNETRYHSDSYIVIPQLSTQCIHLCWCNLRNRLRKLTFTHPRISSVHKMPLTFIFDIYIYYAHTHTLTNTQSNTEPLTSKHANLKESLVMKRKTWEWNTKFKWKIIQIWIELRMIKYQSTFFSIQYHFPLKTFFFFLSFLK